MTARRPAIPASPSAVPVEALRLYLARPAAYFVAALVFQAPVYALLGSATSQTVDQVSASATSGSPDAAVCAVLGSTPGLLGSSLASGLLYIALSAVLASAVFAEAGGLRCSIWQAALVTVARLRPLAGGAILAAIVVALVLGIPLAALGFVQGCYGGESGAGAVAEVRRVVGEAARSTVGRGLVWTALAVGICYVVWVGVRWVVMPQAAVLEGGAPAQALQRSSELVRGRWLAAALVLLALVILQSLVSWLVAIPLTFFSFAFEGGTGDALRGAIRVLTQVAGLPVGAVGATMLYLWLRGAREGFAQADLEREAAALLAGTAPPLAVPSSS